MFKKVEYSILYTKNIEEAKKFYVDILGFTIVEDFGKFVEFNHNLIECKWLQTTSSGSRFLILYPQYW